MYRQKVFKLKKGAHTLAIENSEVDYPYLPAALLAGNFSQDGANLAPYKNDGAGLYGYAGGITQTATLKIPEWAVRVRADTGGLPAELFVDGKSLGRRAWAPYSWVLPRELAGKRAEIKILRETSIARIFGTKAFERPNFHTWLKSQKPVENSKPITPIAEIYFE